MPYYLPSQTGKYAFDLALEGKVWIGLRKVQNKSDWKSFLYSL